MQLATATVDLSITAFFAGVLAIFYVKMTMDVINLRQQKRVPIGDGGHEELTRALMAHESFSSNALFFLLLLALAEAEGISSFLLISLALIFIAARALHAHSIKVYEREKKSYGLRALSVMGTFAVIVVLGIINLYNSVF
jgi:hypothetical protein